MQKLLAGSLAAFEEKHKLPSSSSSEQSTHFRGRRKLNFSVPCQYWWYETPAIEIRVGIIRVPPAPVQCAQGRASVLGEGLGGMCVPHVPVAPACGLTSWQNHGPEWGSLLPCSSGKEFSDGSWAHGNLGFGCTSLEWRCQMCCVLHTCSPSCMEWSFHVLSWDGDGKEHTLVQIL